MQGKEVKNHKSKISFNLKGNNMKALKEKLEAYKNQREQAKEIYIKTIGAIEAIEQLLKEDSKSEKDKK